MMVRQAVGLVLFLSVCGNFATAAPNPHVQDAEPSQISVIEPAYGAGPTAYEILRGFDVAGHFAVDRLKLRAIQQGFALASISTPNYGQYGEPRILMAESRVQNLNTRATMGALMLAAACFMWLGLTVRRSV